MTDLEDVKVLHDWKRIDRFGMHAFTACALCGIIKNTNNAFKQCKGSVRVALRRGGGQ